MELSMGIVKIEISVPEGVKALTKFKENRLKAFEEIAIEIKESVSKAIGRLLNTEMTLFLGKKEQLDNKRNGFKERDYTIKNIGTIRVKMPQDRKGRFKSSIIPKNEVIDPRLKEDIAVLHLAGLSTRVLGMISKRLLGIKISSDTVSASLGLVEERALDWLQRPIDKRYWALYVDGTNFKIQRRGNTASEPSLVVLGIDENNYKSILAIEPGFKDNVESWRSVFNSLIERGLDISSVKLGIMDGLPGLEKLFQEIFLNSVTQRCWVHSLRNAINKAPKRLQQPFKELVHKIMYASSKQDAKNALENLKMVMNNDAKRAINTIDKDFESLTQYFSFDKILWSALKTTNPIERINKELKRRTKSMGTLGERTLEILVAFTALRIENSWRNNRIGSKHHQGLVHVYENNIETAVNEIFTTKEITQ